MSIGLMSEVWRMALPATEKMVLLAFADAANDDGVTWLPINGRNGKAGLQQKTSLSERCIQNCIRKLCDLGFLQRDEKPGKGVVYRVLPRTSCAPAPDAPPHFTTETPAPDAPKPSVTTIPQKATPSSVARVRKPTEPDCPFFVDPTTWRDFWVMRKAKRAAYTDGAARRIVDKLERWRADGHDPNAILDTSITRNWTDVFEPKEPHNDNQSPRSRQRFEKPSGWLAPGPVGAN